MEQLPLSVDRFANFSELAAELFDRYTPVQLERFKTFHQDNPHVYYRFRSLAFEMLRSGRKRYSARTCFEVLRWSYDLKTTSEDFKISNDFIPIYVRLLIYREPAFIGFFSLKGFDLPD